MNTEDIQQIVTDLAQAKGAAQEFAENSVGQFRQVQAAMAGLAQTAGEQLDGLSGQFEGTGQEISENAVPLLQDAVDALLGDLGKLGNLGDVLPGGEKLGGAVDTLTTALGGLSGFLAANGDLIGKIGLSEEHTQRIAQVATTVLTVRSHLVEVGTAATGTMESIKTFTGTLGKAAEAVPALKNVVGPASTALKGLGAIGVTAFVGWEIGKVIGEVTGLNAKLCELAENRALKNQKSDRQRFDDMWVSKHGSLDRIYNGQTARQAWDSIQQRDRERAEKRSRPPEERKPEPVRPTQPEENPSTPKAPTEPAPSPPPEHNHPADQGSPEAIKAGGEEQTKAEEAATDQVLAKREEALQKQETHDQAAIASRETFADEASKTIERGGKQLAQAEKDAADQVRQARTEALKSQRSDDARRVAQLKQQGRALAAAAKQVGGKARAAWSALLQTGTGKEARKARKEAEKQERQKERAEARLERQVAGARRREAELMRAGKTSKEARRQMTTRGRELLAADDLRRAAHRAGAAAEQQRGSSRRTKTHSASPPATDSGPAGQPAATVPLPQPPALSPPPANGAGILDELKSHTRLLSQIARSEGVR